MESRRSDNATHPSCDETLTRSRRRPAPPPFRGASGAMKDDGRLRLTSDVHETSQSVPNHFTHHRQKGTPDHDETPPSDVETRIAGFLDGKETGRRYVGIHGLCGLRHSGMRTAPFFLGWASNSRGVGKLYTYMYAYPRRYLFRTLDTSRRSARGV